MSMLSRRRSTGVGGGHVRSLVETACVLAREHNVFVVEQGTFFPIALRRQLELSGVKFVHMPMSLASLYRTPRRLSHFFRLEHIDLISCVGQFSDIFPYLAAKDNGDTRLIVTKCGGPNSPWYLNETNLIVYSKEDHDYYLAAGVPNVWHCANRASHPRSNPTGIGILKNQHPGHILMRICRIDGTYDHTVLQGARLARELAKTHELSYVVIGKADGEDRLRQLEAVTRRLYPRTFFLSDPQFTTDAATLIEAATYVIGTGRGFMEAASLQKLMFCPVNSKDIPMFIDPKSYDTAFSCNFSGRAEFSDEEIRSGLLRCSSLSKSAESRSQYQEWISYKFEQDFCSEVLPDFYERIRDCALPLRPKPIKSLIHRALKVYGFCYMPSSVANFAKRVLRR